MSFDGEPILTIGSGDSLRPGTEYPVLLTDPDQNLNTGARDHLDVFRDSALIPTITIGNPATLEDAHSVEFHSTSPTMSGGDDSNSSVPDTNSDILLIDTSNVSNASYEMISINLGISASSLASSLIDSSESNTNGTNWINVGSAGFSAGDISYTSLFVYDDGSADGIPYIAYKDSVSGNDATVMKFNGTN